MPAAASAGRRSSPLGWPQLYIIYIMRNAVIGTAGRRLRACMTYFVGSCWQWLGLWLGSCFPARSPSKDEIAA